MARRKMDEPVVDSGLLYDSSDFKSSDGSEDHWRDVHWVYNNLGVKTASAENAPSPGAWFWLVECREDADARRKFRDYYMKMAPSRKELDERARMRDSGDGVKDLLDKVAKVLKEARGA